MTTDLEILFNNFKLVCDLGQSGKCLASKNKSGLCLFNNCPFVDQANNQILEIYPSIYCKLCAKHLLDYNDCVDYNNQFDCTNCPKKDPPRILSDNKN